MKVINPSEYPEFSELYEASQTFHCQMIHKGFQTYEIGPLCSRDHAWKLKELVEAIEKFLETCQEPHGEFVCKTMKKEYRHAKQTLHSTLNYLTDPTP